jgi:3-phenylpropionate/trans-cinnamate dioxygenase ferredoxin subunit
VSTTRVCAVSDVPAGTAKRFDVEGHRIALVRINDDFYAIGDKCSHADYALSEGEVYEKDAEIECWKHGSTFSLTTGEPQMLPATKAVPVYDVEVQGEDVIITLAEKDNS